MSTGQVVVGVVLFGLLSLQRTPVFAEVLAYPPNPADHEWHVDEAPDVVLQGTAQGYCLSVGGSTWYEEIKDIQFTRMQNNMLKVDIVIHLLNPTNCQPGEPCPEYWNYPERVSVWIDWDKDDVWDGDEEWVIRNQE